MRDVPESIIMAITANSPGAETTSTFYAPPQKTVPPSTMPPPDETRDAFRSNHLRHLPPPPPPPPRVTPARATKPSPPPKVETSAPTAAKPSLYSPASKEPSLFDFDDDDEFRIDSPRGHDDETFFSRFLTMEEVSKYASGLANGLYQKGDKDAEQQQEQNISDEVTVTTHYLTLKGLCTLPKLSAEDIASWAYVMSAFQVNCNKKDGRDDNTAAVTNANGAEEASAREVPTTTAVDFRDEPIPHLHEHSDDETCDSVEVDVDAPVEEDEALDYINAMEAAALDMKYPDWNIHVVAQKNHQDCHLGILFAKTRPTAPLIVQRVGGDGIFSNSELLPGMVVREINRRPTLFGVGPEDAFLALKATPPGEVSILAEGLVCTVQRLQRKQKIGLKLKEDESCNVTISKITNKSIFKDTGLQPGMTIQSINGQLCPLSAKAAKFIMKETIGGLQIVVIDSKKLEFERIIMLENGEIEQLFKEQHKISITTEEVTEALPPKSSASARREDTMVPIQSETSILLHGDGLSASRFEVTVSKQETDDQPGITFSRSNLDAPLTIETIDKDGLFGQSNLVEGMIVISINGESMTWKDPIIAAKAVSSSNYLTVVAEAHVTSVIKSNADERVGITLKKTTYGRNKIYIDQIPEGSKFSSTALKPGMVLLTINGTPCPKTIKETRELFANVGEGELTVMAVNVNRQQMDKKHQQKASEEVMETLKALAESPYHNSSGMIFGNDSNEEEGPTAN